MTAPETSVGGVGTCREAPTPSPPLPKPWPFQAAAGSGIRVGGWPDGPVKNDRRRRRAGVLTLGAGLTLGGGGTDDRRGTDAWRRGTNGWRGRTNAGGWYAAVGPWAERLPGPEMGPEWPGLGKGHGSPTGPRPRGRAHSGGEARRGDKEAEASVPVKRGVKELYVQILSPSIKDCRDLEKHKEVSCRTFVAKFFFVLFVLLSFAHLYFRFLPSETTLTHSSFEVDLRAC